LRIRGYEFSIREFAGSLGDFGPLNPFLIGYVAILGVDPVGLFLMMGITNIIIGLVYNMPLSVEAKKVVGATALAQKWKPSQLYAVGVGTGATWILLALSGIIEKVVKVTPKSVVRGIQLSLALTLILESISLSTPNPLLAVSCVLLAVLLLKVERVGRYLPAAIALFVVGLLSAFLVDGARWGGVSFRIPSLQIPSVGEVVSTMVAAGFVQIFLTLGNAVIATAALCRKYYPERKVSERDLALNMGLLNMISPFFGGVPLCHGADGVASQYLFGARTGGSMILEGITEVFLSLFFADSLVAVFSAFPQPVIGAMLVLVAFELARVSVDLRKLGDVAVMLVVVAISFVSNLGIAFIAGIMLHLTLQRLRSRHNCRLSELF
jgi:hypothetical protein